MNRVQLHALRDAGRGRQQVASSSRAACPTPSGRHPHVVNTRSIACTSSHVPTYAPRMQAAVEGSLPDLVHCTHTPAQKHTLTAHKAISSNKVTRDTATRMPCLHGPAQCHTNHHTQYLAITRAFIRTLSKWTDHRRITHFSSPPGPQQADRQHCKPVQPCNE